MQAVHDHHATYPLIKKPTNRLLLTFSPDFALNSQIWLFYAEKWIFLKKLGTLLTATVYIVEQSPFATAQRLDTLNSNAVLANGIIIIPLANTAFEFSVSSLWAVAKGDCSILF